MATPKSIQEALQKAAGHYQAGRLQDAAHICRQILTAAPENAYANNFLGVIFCLSGENERGLGLIRKAIRIKPDFAEAHCSLGNGLKIKGKMQEAKSSFRKALAIRPDYAEAHMNLGNVFAAEKEWEAAVSCYRNALGIKPDWAQAHNNLGKVLREVGRLEDAVASYQKALAIMPNLAGVHNNLGTIFKDRGDMENAIASFRKAVAIEPNYAEAHNNLGNILSDKGCYEEARTCYHNALANKPNYTLALNNLGVVLKELGDLEAAISCYQRALDLDPGMAGAYNNLGTAQKDQGNAAEAIKSYRKALAIEPDYADAHNNLGNALKNQGKLAEALASYRNALSVKPDYAKAHSNLVLTLNYFADVSQEDIYKESLHWDEQHAKSLLQDKVLHGNATGKRRRLRIGYISPDFRKHSVNFFFEPLLKAHDREKVEVFLYSNVKNTDAVTQRLKKRADQWISVVGQNDKIIAEHIAEDNIDILVDLAGHTAHNSLPVLGYKPAPIQVTWLGYPNTTGMSAIDYRFTDAIADPRGSADTLHSEKLYRLKCGFLCYQPDETASDVMDLPSMHHNYVTFGSFNNMAKHTPEVVQAWAEILHLVPEAHLLLKCKSLADNETKARYLQLFENEGIGADRIALLGWLPKEADHMKLYNRVDIGLDPFPYNGTTTTCEALWMGVPVITLLGNRHSGRVGASIMQQIGLQELLVADTIEKYVVLAVELAKSQQRLDEFRKGMRKRMTVSALCDAKNFTQSVEEAYAIMWEEYVS